MTDTTSPQPTPAPGDDAKQWTPVFSTGTDYEADLVRDRLDSAGFEAVIMSKRDRSFGVNVGDLAAVAVLVPAVQVAEAEALLAETIADSDLDEAALAADVNDMPAHSPENEALLDTGLDHIRLSAPDTDDEPLD